MAGAIATASSNMIPSGSNLSAYRSMSYGNATISNTDNSMINAHMHSHNNLSVTNSKLHAKFNLDDLVWAKIMGFPWWPCRLIKDEYNSFFRTSSKFNKIKKKLGSLSMPLVLFL
jgi:hypothetical protein